MLLLGHGPLLRKQHCQSVSQSVCQSVSQGCVHLQGAGAAVAGAAGRSGFGAMSYLDNGAALLVLGQPHLPTPAYQRVSISALHITLCYAMLCYAMLCCPQCQRIHTQRYGAFVWDFPQGRNSLIVEQHMHILVG